MGNANASEAAGFLLRRHWGGMLRSGATTTWERNDPQWYDTNVSMTPHGQAQSPGIRTSPDGSFGGNFSADSYDDPPLVRFFF